MTPHPPPLWLAFFLRLLFLFLITIAAPILSSALPQIPLLHPQHDTLGAIASENRACTEIGISFLQRGGTAADALIGTVFCVGVLDSHHSGIGGGGFALARGQDGRYESVDFREEAPRRAWEGMFAGNVRGSIEEGLASATPGEVRGLWYIHQRYGRLHWKTLLQPAIELADKGFEISEDFASAMDLSTKGYDFLARDPAWVIDFAPNGTRVGKGDRMTRKRYARTLGRIAEIGPEAFYKGAIAEATIETIRKTNGSMTMEDLEGYKVVSRPALHIGYNGYHVSGCGTPASSAVTLSVLKILEGYGQDGKDSLNLSAHRMDEAIKFGYGKRASFGDPDYVDGLDEFEQNMLKDDFAAATRAKISDHHTLNISAYDPGGFESLENHGTSHIVTADASGMAFSLTTTINLFFGSKVMVPETGIILNNEMNDFSIPNISNVFGYYPSPANYVRPKKRPLSSIAPLMAEFNDASLYTVLGASGGSRIITTTVQNALHILDSNMSIKDALISPRLHEQLIPNQVTFEHSYNNETVEYMRQRGHNVTWGVAGSSAQALRVVNGRFDAGGEPRQRNSAGLTT